MATQETSAFLEAVFNDTSVQEVWAMYEALIAPPPYKPAAEPISFPSVTAMPFYPTSHTTIVNNNNVVAATTKKDDEKKKSKGFSAGELVGMVVLGAAITGLTYGLTTTWRKSSNVSEKLETVLRAKRHVCELQQLHGREWELTDAASGFFCIFHQVERSLKNAQKGTVNWKILLAGGLASSTCFFIDVFVNGGITRSVWGAMGVLSLLGTGISWALSSGRDETHETHYDQRGELAKTYYTGEESAKTYYTAFKAWRDAQPSAPPLL